MSIDFLSLAAPGVAGLQPYQSGKPIEELKREYGISNAIKLASNENPLGPGELALKAMRACEKTLGRYPDGNGFTLKKRLAEHLGVRSDMITLGNGSSEILELVARTFVTPANQVLFSQHAFAVYPILTQAIGAEAIVTPAKNRGHDLEAMRKAITDRTRLIFVTNPNNPTGTWVNSKELYRFLKAVPDHAIVIVDEAYFEYVLEEDYPDSIQWLNDFPNLVVTRTFSKIHGLAGLRIGYGVSHPEVAELLNRVRQPFNSNAMALAAAEAALSDRNHVENSITINSNGMRQLTAAFDRLGLNYIPSVGNFICVEFDRPGLEIYQALLRKGVIIRPVGIYGLPNHLRATIGLEEENDRFLRSLEEIL